MVSIGSRGTSRGIVPESRPVSQCKLCRDAIRTNDDRIWCTAPIGLVHVRCATSHNAPTAGPVTPGSKYKN